MKAHYDLSLIPVTHTHTCTHTHTPCSQSPLPSKKKSWGVESGKEATYDLCTYIHSFRTHDYFLDFSVSCRPTISQCHTLVVYFTASSLVVHKLLCSFACVLFRVFHISSSPGPPLPLRSPLPGSHTASPAPAHSRYVSK